MWLLSWRALCVGSIVLSHSNHSPLITCDIIFFIHSFPSVFLYFVYLSVSFQRSASLYFGWVTSIMVYLPSLHTTMISWSSAFVLCGFKFFLLSSVLSFFFVTNWTSVHWLLNFNGIDIISLVKDFYDFLLVKTYYLMLKKNSWYIYQVIKFSLCLNDWKNTYKTCLKLTQVVKHFIDATDKKHIWKIKSKPKVRKKKHLCTTKATPIRRRFNCNE